jgi:hypothetical protein
VGLLFGCGMGQAEEALDRDATFQASKSLLLCSDIPADQVYVMHEALNLKHCTVTASILDLGVEA